MSSEKTTGCCGFSNISDKKKNQQKTPAENSTCQGTQITQETVGETRNNAEICCGSTIEDLTARAKEAHDSRIRENVKKAYAAAIQQNSCCGTSDQPSAAMQTALKATKLGYQQGELAEVPENATKSSFGCGNPLAFSGVADGDTVVDLGSGAGLDCFLAAKRVGPTGKVIGLDMTPEMIEKARSNAQEGGYSNVEFRQGEMEVMPIDDNSVDWVISNCVINLSPDKEAVFREAFRVLKTGGRILISDIVTQGVPDEIKRAYFSWSGCLGGALEEKEYLDVIRKAGFQEVKIVSKMDNFLSSIYNRPLEMLPDFSKKVREEYPEEYVRRIHSIQVYAEKH